MIMRLSRVWSHSVTLRMKSQILTTLPFLILAIFFFVSPVSADTPLRPTSSPNWLAYAVEVLVGETVAWLIGAELLWRLSRKRKLEVSRSEIYKIMLLIMIISFSIGLLFWITFGLI